MAGIYLLVRKLPFQGMSVCVCILLCMGFTSIMYVIAKSCCTDNVMDENGRSGNKLYLKWVAIRN